ncbi:MAG: NADH:flavin oxidoreductase/NADH oxidase [Defluviitaleaceae bacterium]|nr:NADH:flavin oxidoreductase/NADH oxidase [Defluviitaleaceae bacterium]
MAMNDLFTTYQIKGLELKNRVVMPPMCNYAIVKKDGIPTDWHFVHYASRAIGGTGLIIIEMTNVEPDGRISDRCMGLWDDAQIEPLKRIVDACHGFGAKVAIQIAHAGRKAEDAPTPVAPSALAFDANSKTPRALETSEVKEMVVKFRDAVGRAVKAGVDAIEIHGAHGYLIHQFHSPLTNLREDAYGQDLTLFGKEVIQAAKEVMPSDMPLLMRISAVEYVEKGYQIEDAIKLAKAYQSVGVDVFHITSGGEGPIDGSGRPGTHVGYQVPFARKIKEALDLPIIAVGRLDEPHFANSIIGNDEADLVAVGRGMLRNPNWTLEAAAQLGKEVQIENPGLKLSFNL